jgi:hypothetical protein
MQTSSGFVSIADNGTQVVFVDGVDGYEYNIETSVFSEITDPEFYPANFVAFQDGYLIFNKAGTNQAFFSGLYDTSFDGLDIFFAEGSPDPINAIVSNNQNVFVFGPQAIEAFYNSGDADQPFTRIQGAVIDTGCVAPGTIVRLESSLYFVGGGETGGGIVYAMSGYQPQRISTPSVEAEIRSVPTEDLSRATAYAYQQGGHLFYCLNLPGSSSTWVYDASTQLWHERCYLNFTQLERDLAECHAFAYNENVVGDYSSGKLYALDQDYTTDNGISIKRLRRSPHVSEKLVRLRHDSFQLDMETGVGTSGTGQGTDPKVMMRWSDDGGHSWSNEQWVSCGKIGEYRTRAIWRRLGMSRDRVYEVSITDPVKAVLIGAELDVEGGAS